MSACKPTGSMRDCGRKVWSNPSVFCHCREDNPRLLAVPFWTVETREGEPINCVVRLEQGKNEKRLGRGGLLSLFTQPPFARSLQGLALSLGYFARPLHYLGSAWSGIYSQLCERETTSNKHALNAVVAMWVVMH